MQGRFVETNNDKLAVSRQRKLRRLRTAPKTSSNVAKKSVKRLRGNLLCEGGEEFAEPKGRLIMEKVKEYLECVNPHWLAVVGTGLYIHLREICIIGLCIDKMNDTQFCPSYASILFIFSTMCLLAEYRLWPRSLKEPPVQMLYVYEMLVAALVTNLATQILWIPLMHGIWCLTDVSSKWLAEFNSTLSLDRYSILAIIADYLSNENTAMGMAFCMSLLSFVWMLDATESLDGLLDIWAK